MSSSKATTQLAQIRKAIDNVDNDIIQLIAERMLLSLSVGFIKHQEGLAISHPEREQQILHNLASKAAQFNGLVSGDLVSSIYQNILNASVSLQQQLIVSLQQQGLTTAVTLLDYSDEVASNVATENLTRDALVQETKLTLTDVNTAHLDATVATKRATTLATPSSSQQLLPNLPELLLTQCDQQLQVIFDQGGYQPRVATGQQHYTTAVAGVNSSTTATEATTGSATLNTASQPQQNSTAVNAQELINLLLQLAHSK